MKNKVLIASTNPHKVEKLTWIVEGFFSSIETPTEIGLTLDVEEIGKTFEENAILKAVRFSQEYGGYVIASDGGAIIPSLGSNWDGLRTKRFAGEEATDLERIEKLLSMIKDKQGDERLMIWREAIAIAKNGQVLFSQEVEGASGVLQDSFDPTKYKPGIWVCSIWYFPELNKNFFDMTEKEREFVESSWHKLYRETRKYLEKYRGTLLPIDLI